MRLVVIDVGNTSTTIALYDDGVVSRVTPVKGGIRDQYDRCRDLLGEIASETVEGVSIASVVPAVNDDWTRLVHQALGCLPRFVSCKSPLNFTIDYPKPHRIGADRLADAAGGIKRYGAPLIVVDFGTALNFEVIDDSPAYIGGVLAPGLPLMTSYLHEKTALLPMVKLPCPPPTTIGKSTEQAIEIGALIGYRGIVREIVSHLQQNFDRLARVVATGGFAHWVLADAQMDCVLDPDLTLFGLGVIFEQGGSD